MTMKILSMNRVAQPVKPVQRSGIGAVAKQAAERDLPDLAWNDRPLVSTYRYPQLLSQKGRFCLIATVARRWASHHPHSSHRCDGLLTTSPIRASGWMISEPSLTSGESTSRKRALSLADNVDLDSPFVRVIKPGQPNCEDAVIGFGRDLIRIH